MSNSKPLGSDPVDKDIEYRGTNPVSEILLGDFGDYVTSDDTHFAVGKREEARDHQRRLNDE